MKETLGDPQEKGMATHSSILLKKKKINKLPTLPPPLQYSCLENLMDRGTWQDTVHGVAKSRTGLSDYHSPPLSTRLLLDYSTVS